MPPRKPRPVTLAKIGEQRAVAESAIRKFGALGAKRSDGPTPERLLQAGGAAKVERFADTAVIMDGSRTGEVEVEAVRVRIDDAPFERLCNGRLIAKEPGRNLALCTAGIRYRGAWERASAGNLRTVSFAERVQGGKGVGLFASESAAGALQSFQRMRAAVQAMARPFLDAVLLRDSDLETAGRLHSGFTGRAQATGIASFCLKAGLADIARQQGLIEPDDEP